MECSDDTLLDIHQYLGQYFFGCLLWGHVPGKLRRWLWCFLKRLCDVFLIMDVAPGNCIQRLALTKNLTQGVRFAMHDFEGVDARLARKCDFTLRLPFFNLSVYKRHCRLDI